MGFSGAESRNQKMTNFNNSQHGYNTLSSSFNSNTSDYVNSVSLDDNSSGKSYSSDSEIVDGDSYSSCAWGVGSMGDLNAHDNNIINSSSTLTGEIKAPDSQLDITKGVKHLCEQIYLNVSDYGSLLNNGQTNSNYSQFSIKGASENNSHAQERSKSNNVNNENTLHKQWGLTFNENLLAVENVHCRIIENDDMASWLKLAYTEANKYNVPNYKGARIKEVSNLNVKQFRQLLQNYKFSRVIDYVEFGFPLALDYENFTYINTADNHKSAIQHPVAVSKYMETEVGHKAIVGPFETSPFKRLHVSPMVTRPKPDGRRKIIVDLSWPKGCGVNSRIADNEFDSYPCALK